VVAPLVATLNALAVFAVMLPAVTEMMTDHTMVVRSSGSVSASAKQAWDE
jgi:hypothetical protein